LAEVDPTCVGGLTSYGVTNLTALRESVSFEKVNFFKFHDNLYFNTSLIFIDKIIFTNNSLKIVQQMMKNEKPSIAVAQQRYIKR
jgi:hypothetical protein